MSCGSHKRLAVLIAGLNVTITGNSAQRYGPKPHWDILRLFYENLAVYKFAAIHVDRLKGATEFDYPLDSSLDIVQLNSRPYCGVSRFQQSPTVFRRLLREIAGSDYVFIRFPSWVGLTAYRCARLLNKPYWVSVHGNWSEIIRNYELTAPEALTKLYYRLNRKCVENTFSSIVSQAECTFAVGEVLKESCESYGAYCVAYHDTTHSASDVWPVRGRFRNSEVSLLYIGEVSLAKGIDTLLQAADQLANRGMRVRLTIVGRGPKTAELLNTRKHDFEIDYKGWVSHGPAFDALFEQADALILPSLTEGVPRVVIEAMVRSTPIIASTVGDIPHILGNGERGWLVRPQQPGQIADAVEQARTSTRLTISKVVAASEYAKVHDKKYWTDFIRARLNEINPHLVS